MTEKKKARTAAGLALAGALVAGGAYTAINAYAESPSASPSASSTPSQGANGNGAGNGQGEKGQRQSHQHTAATADETTKVTAAVKAKDSSASVTKVEKDPDGSFDVTATKDGNQVRYEVSADYKTVTEGRGGRGGHGAGEGHRQGTEVTGTELTKVTAAVKAKDSAFTVEKVFKDSDGDYHVMGTKDGSRAGYEVSSDLKTITAHSMERKGR